MRLFFVAGESSGDLHGAHLIHALKKLAPTLECEGLGGRQMADAGMVLRHDLASEAIMGFTEVVKHFLPIRRLFLDTVKHLRESMPDAVILIDYPGFNIRLAKEVHQLGIPVIYYVSPQVWAWKKKRLHTLAKYVSLMLVIFPFEESLYTNVGLKCVFVGHPLLDYIPAGDIRSANLPIGSFSIGLLPGSRAQEIERLLPPMLKIAHGIQTQHPQAQFVVPCVNEARATQIKAIIEGEGACPILSPPLKGDLGGCFLETTTSTHAEDQPPCLHPLSAGEGSRSENGSSSSAAQSASSTESAVSSPLTIEITLNNTYDLLRDARFCLVASGTATLETALHGVPFVILYKVSPVTYQLARLVVDIEFIGIVNILAGRGVVPEYIQHAADPGAILPQALDLIADTPARAQMIADLAAIRGLLGSGGASDRAAATILEFLPPVSHV